MFNFIRQHSRSLLLGLGIFFASLAPQVARADVYFNCTPDSVMEFGTRVHVHCLPGIIVGADTISFFAINTTDAEEARRFITLATSALLSKKFFRVLVPTSSATNVAGCLATDCRTPTVFGVKD